MENASFLAGEISFCLSVHKFKYSSLCSTIWERICSKSHQLQTIFPSFGWHRQCRPDIPGKQRGWAGWDLPELTPNQTSPNPEQGQLFPQNSQSPRTAVCPCLEQLCPSSSLCLCQEHPGTASRDIHTRHGPAAIPGKQLCLQIPFSAPSWAG